MKRRKTLVMMTIIISLFFLPIPLTNSLQTNHPQTNQLYTVDDEGDGDFTSIQTAIQQAQSGDIIHIYSGTYEENLTINQPQLTIEGKPYELGSGNDENQPIIQGLHTGHVINIYADETTISDLIIHNSGSSYFDAGIGIYSNKNTITSNGITNNFYGIILNNCSTNTITGNYILANTMDGIYLAATQQNSITDNIIKENGFQGMFLYETNHNQITENTLNLNGKDGIQLRDKCNHNEIMKNTIHSNNIDGIKIWMKENNQNIIKKNTIYSNGWNGIHLMNGEYNHILENDITLNLFNGIHIGESSNNIIARNTIQDNKEQGIMILFESSVNNKFYYNNIINDNAYDNGNNQWNNDADSAGNYWSYYTGTDENQDGIGDVPYSILGNNNQDNYPIMNQLTPPATPNKPTGLMIGTVGKTYTYTTMATDTGPIQYGWDWDGDYTVDEWTPFYETNQPCETSHTYTTNGAFQISVKAMNTYGFQSEWSEPITVTMPKSKQTHHSFFDFINALLQFITKNHLF